MTYALRSFEYWAYVVPPRLARQRRHEHRRSDALSHGDRRRAREDRQPRRAPRRRAVSRLRRAGNAGARPRCSWRRSSRPIRCWRRSAGRAQYFAMLATPLRTRDVLIGHQLYVAARLAGVVGDLPRHPRGVRCARVAVGDSRVAGGDPHRARAFGARLRRTRRGSSAKRESTRCSASSSCRCFSSRERSFPVSQLPPVCASDRVRDAAVERRRSHAAPDARNARRSGRRLRTSHICPVGRQAACCSHRERTRGG